MLYAASLIKMCGCTCRALVTSCFASSPVRPVMAVHPLRHWRTGCLLACCQPEFFKSWRTFNAVGEFVTQRKPSSVECTLKLEITTTHNTTYHIMCNTQILHSNFQQNTEVNSNINNGCSLLRCQKFQEQSYLLKAC